MSKFVNFGINNMIAQIWRIFCKILQLYQAYKTLTFESEKLQNDATDFKVPLLKKFHEKLCKFMVNFNFANFRKIVLKIITIKNLSQLLIWCITIGISPVRFTSS